jgi:hypothetical protein
MGTMTVDIGDALDTVREETRFQLPVVAKLNVIREDACKWVSECRDKS